MNVFKSLIRKEMLFRTKDEKEWKNYELATNTLEGYNFSYEREFKLEVLDWLNDGKPKLFKSPTEGNILVRLMNTSFTPEQVLGRMIYSFSTTMYEIDDLTLENIDKYKIQNIGTRITPVQKPVEKQSRINMDFSDSEMRYLISVLQQEAGAFDTIDKINEVISFESLNMQFTSEPYLIYIGNDGSIYKADANTVFTDGVPYMGYIVYINNDPVVLGSAGHFNLSKEDGVEIQSLYAEEGQAEIECHYTVYEIENIEDDPQYIRYRFQAGQEIITASPTTNIMQDIIIPKIAYQENKKYEKIAGIYSIRLEAEPYSTFYIKDTSSDNFKRYVVGKTGELKISELDYPIEAIYAVGTSLREVQRRKDPNSESNILVPFYSMEREWEFDRDYYVNKTIYDTCDKVENPVDKMMYRIEALQAKNSPPPPNIKMILNYATEYDDYYEVIYYKDEWCYLTRDGEAIRPITCMIDYICEIEEGEYA